MAIEAEGPLAEMAGDAPVALFATWMALTHPEAARTAAPDTFENPAVTARLISTEDGVAPDFASVFLRLVP